MVGQIDLRPFGVPVARTGHDESLQMAPGSRDSSSFNYHTFCGSRQETTNAYEPDGENQQRIQRCVGTKCKDAQTYANSSVNAYGHVGIHKHACCARTSTWTERQILFCFS